MGLCYGLWLGIIMYYPKQNYSGVERGHCEKIEPFYSLVVGEQR